MSFIDLHTTFMTRRSVLQDEIAQSRPFSSASQEATLGLFRTADQLKRHLAQAIEPAGVTMQQYNVLRILRGAGDEGLPTLSIAERMIERTPGITRLIDKLNRRGLVRRERQQHDRRCVLCFVTDDGLALLRTLDEPVETADTDSLGMLTEDETEQLISLLDRIRAGLPETPPSP